MAVDRWISDARIFAEVTRAKIGGAIHVIGGPREGRVTIYSQQCRAINLVCALRERDPELTEKSVAVIGAGAAGMTAAGVLLAMGLPKDQLTVYERAASPLYTQRWSYSRFLHPRLFHWPEAGWSDGKASLPIADWSGGYAAAVREEILSRCASPTIKFCTTVEDVRVEHSKPRVWFSRLHDGITLWKDFDIVLVATGFSPEPKVADTKGGTYWHGLDGLDDLRGDVHVVGDGDGALAEVLMMLIDRFGHAAVQRLCELLPLDHIDALHVADLEAQGNPRAESNPCREHIQSNTIKLIFALLVGAAPHPRTITIHAKNPLSGTSFLLNRALVSHLTWKPKAMVQLHGGPKVQPQEVCSLGGSVIWRAGVGSVPIPSFAEAHMTNKGLIAELERICEELEPARVPEPFDVGLLTGLLDGLRRPMWTPRARRIMKSGIKSLGGWTAPQARLSRVRGRPTDEAKRLLSILVATEEDLKRLGLPGADAVDWSGARWISIDVLARAGSCAHAELVTPVRPRVNLHFGPTSPSNPPTQPTGLCRDDHHRLWFEIPSDAETAEPTRAAVCATVDPRDVAHWASKPPSGAGDRRQDARELLAREVSAEVLRGLSDLARSDTHTQMLLASLYEERGEWEAARSAYVRAGRKPGGRLLGSARRENGGASTNVPFRRVLLALGSCLSRMLPRDSALVDHAIWLMLSSAAADLVTIADRSEVVLELSTTPAFLTNVWAPRVRTVLTPPGARTPNFDYAPPPEWAIRLADTAVSLRRRPRTPTQIDMFAGIRELATATARQAHAETSSDALLTLSELGVWPAGTDLDQELRSSMHK
jgi:hypothetical protein